jgi:hypothetical protein
MDQDFSNDPAVAVPCLQRLALNEKCHFEKQVKELTALLAASEKMSAVLGVENRELKVQLQQRPSVQALLHVCCVALCAYRISWGSC